MQVGSPAGDFTLRTYDARIGLAYAVSPTVSASLGLRADGTPVHDLIGRSDGVRFPARIHGEFFRGAPLASPDQAIEAGDLANVLLFASYARRFSRSLQKIDPPEQSDVARVVAHGVEIPPEPGP